MTPSPVHFPCAALLACPGEACTWHNLGPAGVQRDKGKVTTLVNSQLTSCLQAQQSLCQPGAFKTMRSLWTHTVFFKVRAVRKRALIWELAYMWELRKSDSRQFPETILDKLPSFYDYFFPQAKYFYSRITHPSRIP